jgi:hypothetical protein
MMESSTAISSVNLNRANEAQFGAMRSVCSVDKKLFRIGVGFCVMQGERELVKVRATLCLCGAHAARPRADAPRGTQVRATPAPNLGPLEPHAGVARRGMWITR